MNILDVEKLLKGITIAIVVLGIVLVTLFCVRTYKGFKDSLPCNRITAKGE